MIRTDWRATPMALAPGRHKVSRRTPLGWMIPALATVLLVSLPLVYLVVRAGQNGWLDYFHAVATPHVGALVLRTGLLVVGAVALAAVIALPAAWLVVRSDLPGRRLWAVLIALPLVFPTYVSAFALVAVLGPRGYLQSWLSPLGVTALPEWIYGYSGALLALSLFTYPYVYLPLVAALRDLDPALEESARSLGASRWSAFFTIVLPQLRPALGAGSLLVGLYALSDFGAVSIVRYSTLTLSIYNAYSTLFDRTKAAALATVLVLLTAAVIAWEAWQRRQAQPSRSRPSRPATPVALGRRSFWAYAFLGVLVTLSLLLPVGVIGYWGLRGGRIATPSAPWSEVGAALLNSLTIAGIAAGLAVLLSVPLAVWAVRYPSRLARAVERLAFAGYALPGLVIALSLVFFSVRHARPLYQTLPLLALAYLVRFLPQAVAATRSALAMVAPSFEEAARSLGRSPLEVLRTVTLPMIMPGVLTGGALVFLTSMKELPATLLLRPIGFETLATTIWSYAAEAIYSAASLPALVLVAVTALPLYFLVIRPVLGERSPASRPVQASAAPAELEPEDFRRSATQAQEPRALWGEV